MSGSKLAKYGDLTSQQILAVDLLVLKHGIEMSYTEIAELVGVVVKTHWRDEIPEFQKEVRTRTIELMGESLPDVGFKYACDKLIQMKIDAIEVSGAWHCYTHRDEFYFKEYAEKVALGSKVPIILVGGNRNYDSMTSVLNETSIEYFSL